MGDPNFAMAARIGDSMPCETLYACNLCDKVKKEELRALLYTLFVQYGDVIDIVHMRTAKMRGQAFIVFEETSSATAALRALQGFNFLGREVKLEFARSKSFATAKRDGTFKPMQKEAEKRKAAAAAAVQLAKRANQTENGMEGRGGRAGTSTSSTRGSTGGGFRRAEQHSVCAGPSKGGERDDVRDAVQAVQRFLGGTNGPRQP